MSNTQLYNRILQTNLLPRFIGRCNPHSLVDYEVNPSDLSVRATITYIIFGTLFMFDISQLRIVVSNAELMKQRVHGTVYMIAYLLVLLIQVSLLLFLQ